MEVERIRKIEQELQDERDELDNETFKQNQPKSKWPSNMQELNDVKDSLLKDVRLQFEREEMEKQENDAERNDVIHWTEDSA